MVVGEGFEPSKSMTADLQSAPFGRSGTPPRNSWISISLEIRETLNLSRRVACRGKRGASYQMKRGCKVLNPRK